MWNNIEIIVSFVIFVGALIFAVYSFYNNSITVGVGALIAATVNIYYMIKALRAKREDNY
ncbi:hypothetical protein ACQE30_07755 [Staphylococcus cohnii]|uniref:hypothetical protein n=1 Tax=Staphylococcus cohnii species complex TaxID=3239053 RepID=UPI0007D9AD3A|nr:MULTISPECIES: hypothetical protein [Staphylococcus]MDU0462129.1 hypothetical protein [Staphylococcus ureilyticus]MDV3052932.1 hypothetical protein [Staphylococcus ureilyticus]OAO10896.1 hypothetical protein A4A82_04550 [Staphylococcus cohnii]PTF26645.1 hypothetical protein BUY19_10055 [Staphylococcus cohnii]UXS59918.1 hypothetical protein MUA21_12595 [Staphylococcus ureilyticus]